MPKSGKVVGSSAAAVSAGSGPGGPALGHQPDPGLQAGPTEGSQLRLDQYGAAGQPDHRGRHRERGDRNRRQKLGGDPGRHQVGTPGGLGGQLLGQSHQQRAGRAAVLQFR